MLLILACKITTIFLNKEEGIRILNKLNLPYDIRAEKLTLQDFANLTDEYLNL